MIDGPLEIQDLLGRGPVSLDLTFPLSGSRITSTHTLYPSHVIKQSGSQTHRGEFQGRVVVVKSAVLPDATSLGISRKGVTRIGLCEASRNHPNVVQFLGSFLPAASLRRGVSILSRDSNSSVAPSDTSGSLTTRALTSSAAPTEVMRDSREVRPSFQGTSLRPSLEATRNTASTAQRRLKW